MCDVYEMYQTHTHTHKSDGVRNSKDELMSRGFRVMIDGETLYWNRCFIIRYSRHHIPHPRTCSDIVRPSISCKLQIRDKVYQQLKVLLSHSLQTVLWIRDRFLLNHHTTDNSALALIVPDLSPQWHEEASWKDLPHRWPGT